MGTIGTLNDIFPASSLGFPVLAGFVSIVVWHLSMLCVGTAVVVNIHHYDENYKNKIVEKIVQSKFVRRLGLIPKRPKQIITEQQEDLLKETEMSTKTSTNIDQLTVQLMQIMNPKPEVKASMWKTFAVILDRFFFFIHMLLLVSNLVRFYVKLFY